MSNLLLLSKVRQTAHNLNRSFLQINKASHVKQHTISPTFHVSIPRSHSSSQQKLDFSSLSTFKMATPDITLYTNYACPWAHRAQIILKELGLPFKTEIIDLTVPRTAEYLKINPRGLVPSINYNGTIITESAIVSQFLADAHPSHILKTSTEEGGALQRARIAYFVDAYFSKVNGLTFTILQGSESEKEVTATKFVDAIVKEIEPLLHDAKPFFGGASKLTLAEVSLLIFTRLKYFINTVRF